MLDILLLLILILLFVTIIGLLVDGIELLIIEYKYNTKKITFEKYLDLYQYWFDNTILGKLIMFFNN